MILFLWYLNNVFCTIQVPNSAIKDCKGVLDFSGKNFVDPDEDKTIKAVKDE